MRSETSKTRISVRIPGERVEGLQEYSRDVNDTHGDSRGS